MNARPRTHRADQPAVLFKGSRMGRRIALATGGAVVAAGLTATGGVAASADDSVWNKVAQCESSGNWSINTGNGYYGGLQFSKSTWKAFGGTKYASTANKATKAEQIAIAKRTLYAQGPGAWPTCGKKAGLTKKNGGADKNATPSSSSSKSSGSSSSSSSSKSKLEVDGKFGPKTTKATQKWLGKKQDGSLSKADIKALQKKVGAKQDGHIGPETTRKLRKHLGLGDNGSQNFRTDPSSVKALQKYLNKR
jgi:hypothetical protein